MDKQIINYGLVEPSQRCSKCERPNHKDNTHCWYCKKKLIEDNDLK